MEASRSEDEDGRRGEGEGEEEKDWETWIIGFCSWWTQVGCRHSKGSNFEGETSQEEQSTEQEEPEWLQGIEWWRSRGRWRRRRRGRRRSKEVGSVVVRFYLVSLVFAFYSDHFSRRTRYLQRANVSPRLELPLSKAKSKVASAKHSIPILLLSRSSPAFHPFPHSRASCFQ